MQSNQLFKSFNRNKGNPKKKTMTPLFQPQQLTDDAFSEDDNKPFPAYTLNSQPQQPKPLTNSPSLKARFKCNPPMYESSPSGLKNEFKLRHEPDALESLNLSENDSEFLSFDNCAVIDSGGPDVTFLPSMNEQTIPNTIKKTPTNKSAQNYPQTPDENNLFDFVNNMKSLMLKKAALENDKMDLQKSLQKRNSELETGKKLETKALEFINEFENNKPFYDARIKELEDFSKFMAGIVKSTKESSECVLSHQTELSNDFNNKIQSLNQALTKADTTIVDLNSEIQTLTLNKSENEKQIALLELTSITTTNALVQSNAKIDALSSDNKSQNTSIAQLAQKLEDAANNYKNVLPNLSKYQDSLKSMTAENAESQKLLSLSNQELQAITKQYNLLVTQSNAFTSTISSLQFDLDLVNSDNHDLKIKLSTSVTLNSSLNDKITDLQMNGKDSKTLVDKFEVLYNSILKLNADKSELNVKLDLMQQNQQTMAESINTPIVYNEMGDENKRLILVNKQQSELIQGISILLNADKSSDFIQLVRQLVNDSSAGEIKRQHLTAELAKSLKQQDLDLGEIEKLKMEVKTREIAMEENKFEMAQMRKQLEKKNAVAPQLETPKPRKRGSNSEKTNKKRQKVKVESDVVFY